MGPNYVFNATVCLIGVVILLIHSANLLLKKDRRKDENVLLLFLLFTVFHFALYFIYTMIKFSYTSNSFIIAFYTAFYIMNNFEALLFYLYLISYADVQPKLGNIFNQLNATFFVLFILSDILNVFFHFYFNAVDGVYQRMPTMIIAQGYQFFTLASSFILVLSNDHLVFREKFPFFLYCILPTLSIVAQIFMPGYAIAYTTLLASIEILFLFLNVEKNIKISDDERQIKDARIRIMTSQIQPHFIYNTLSAISTLIDINPSEAQKALDEFTSYLRMNFSTLTETKLVPFDDELKHIKTYVNLEKLRFRNRLEVEYDIKEHNFSLPPLSIQPLVENAIKHGILKKIEGGKVILKSYQEEDANVVEVIDDGVGFDPESAELKTNKHIGLKNVASRISTMIHGEMNIYSKPNEGTRIVVKFYR